MTCGHKNKIIIEIKKIFDIGTYNTLWTVKKLLGFTKYLSIESIHI